MGSANNQAGAPLRAARLLWRHFGGGDSTTNATIRRTSGSTAIKVGNATSHDNAHAAGQVETKAGVGPRLISVETPDMTKVISSDRTSGSTIAA